MADREVARQDPEDSEAMEVRQLLADITSSARLWTWSEEDPYPRGIARVEHDGLVGWPRGPLVREVRAAMGAVSRVALRRAREALGWRAYDWRLETAYLRVWATKPKTEEQP